MKGKLLRIFNEKTSFVGFEFSISWVHFQGKRLAEWTRCLPGREWAAFITKVLDLYQAIGSDHPSENNTFKFYQMEVISCPR